MSEYIIPATIELEAEVVIEAESPDEALQKFHDHDWDVQFDLNCGTARLVHCDTDTSCPELADAEPVPDPETDR